MNTKTETVIRWLLRRDMPDVLDIDRRSFCDPWGEAVFMEFMRQRNCIGMVAEQAERVVGFVIYELHKSKLCTLRLAVHPEERRCGIGRTIIDMMIGKLNEQRQKTIQILVRDSSLPAQQFLKASGFLCTEVFREEYGEWDDGYLFEYRI